MELHRTVILRLAKTVLGLVWFLPLSGRCLAERTRQHEKSALLEKRMVPTVAIEVVLQMTRQASSVHSVTSIMIIYFDLPRNESTDVVKLVRN
jgi:hypothetical protein